MGVVNLTRLNIKNFRWDSTCIHGGPFMGATVGPHAINQAATFDVQLVEAMSNATADELRAYSILHYKKTGEITGLTCDGGPLANTAHDPRWGRICETYGEDPFLITRMSTTAMRAMQQPLADATGARTFLKTSQTTRHFMGYHGANDLDIPTMDVSERDLRDQFLPGYEALQINGTAWDGHPGGRAEGIMCSFAIFDGVPSCANDRLLKALLRQEWGSNALVQSDCCNSISSVAWFNYSKTEEQAVAAVFAAGTQLAFNGGPAEIDGLQKALGDGSVKMAQLDAALARMFLTRMRLGEFERGPHPYSYVNASVIGSQAHQDLVRKVAAASVVMATNQNKALPILSPLPTRKISIVGPFADCGECYLHSYNGVPGHIVSYVEAISTLARQTGAIVKTSSNNCSSFDGCAVDQPVKAAALAAEADLVVLVVGLGNTEHEGGDRLALTLPDCPAECRGAWVPASPSIWLPNCPATCANATQGQLMSAVKQAVTPRKTGNRTQRLVLVVVAGGPVAIPDADDYDAILYAGYGGQAAGFGVADIIFGAVSPSGRFPTTVYEPDYIHKVGALQNFSSTSGVGRTYRYLDLQKSIPQFQFGFGLSFATYFTYSELTIDLNTNGSVAVHATVTNDSPIGSPSWGSGAMEIAQMYVKVPRQPSSLPVPFL
jgi:beta-glucosidase